MLNGKLKVKKAKDKITAGKRLRNRSFYRRLGSLARIGKKFKNLLRLRANPKWALTHRDLREGLKTLAKTIPTVM